MSRRQVWTTYDIEQIQRNNWRKKVGAKKRHVEKETLYFDSEKLLVQVFGVQPIIFIDIYYIHKYQKGLKQRIRYQK